MTTFLAPHDLPPALRRTMSSPTPQGHLKASHHHHHLPTSHMSMAVVNEEQPQELSLYDMSDMIFYQPTPTSTITPNMLLLGGQTVANGAMNGVMAGSMAGSMASPMSGSMASAMNSMSSTDDDVSFHQPFQMDRARTLSYLDAELTATPKRHHSQMFETPQDIGLLTPMSAGSTGACSMTHYKHQHQSHNHQQNLQNLRYSQAPKNPFMTPQSPERPQKLDFGSHPGVKLEFSSERRSPLQNDSDMSTGINPFYSPPSYIATPQPQYRNNRNNSSAPVSAAAAAAAAAAQVALDVKNFSATPSLSSGSESSSMPTSPESTIDIMAQGKAAADAALQQHHFEGYDNNSTPRKAGPGRAPKPVGAIVLKPHRCQMCMKSFRRLEHLKRHMKIHTEERPFICDVRGCDKRFSRSDNLRAHRRTHMKKGGRNIFIEGLEVK